MVSIFDIIHYLIGMIILACLLWILIQTHNYFSKDNVEFKTLKNTKT
jgi:hypothetical protein